MITFPSNPTIGQLHEVGGRSFRFNGTGWVVAAIPGGVVTQTTGQSIADVMSQKAVTDALGTVQGTTDHRDLTEESRFANDQHIIGSVTGLTEKLDQLDTKDNSLQEQILTMQENNPVQQIRYLTSDPIVLNTETFYQSKADKGTAPAFEIIALITATTPETADIVAQWVGVALTQPLELIEQITSLLIKARKNGTQRTVTLFAEFYDYTAAGVKTLKGVSSQVILTESTTAYDLYFPIQAYLAAAGSRGLVVVKGFQTGAGAAASIILSIEGDYYSRWSYTIPTSALLLQDTQIKSTQDLPAIGSPAGESQKDINAQIDAIIDDTDTRLTTIENTVRLLPEKVLDDKVISSQDLPSIGALAGESQKDVNYKQNLLNADHEQRLDAAETQLAGNQLTFAAIYGYYNFI